MTEGFDFSNTKPNYTLRRLKFAAAIIGFVSSMTLLFTWRVSDHMAWRLRAPPSAMGRVDAMPRGTRDGKAGLPLTETRAKGRSSWRTTRTPCAT